MLGIDDARNLRAAAVKITEDSDPAKAVDLGAGRGAVDGSARIGKWLAVPHGANNKLSLWAICTTLRGGLRPALAVSGSLRARAGWRKWKRRAESRRRIPRPA